MNIFRRSPKAIAPAEEVSSPDFLERDAVAGSGVRRLNRRPLLIIGGLLVLVLFTIMYTVQQKGAAMNVQSGSAPLLADVENVDMRAIFGDMPRSGIVPQKHPQTTASKSDATPQAQAFSNVAPTSAVPTTQSIARGEPQTLSMPEKTREQTQDERMLAAAQLEARRQYFEQLKAAREATTTLALDASVGTAGGTNSAGLLGGRSGSDGSGPGQLLPDRSSDDPNRQDEKKGFLERMASTQDYLTNSLNPPLSSFEVKAGTVIPSVMVGGLNSDLPGQIIGQVREDVYDTATGNHLLIPKGSRLIGTYDSRVTMGQSRALVAWNRIIYPDASSINIGTMAGADQGGYAGFNDLVDNHYLRVFGNALLLSVFSAGIQLSQPQPSGNGNGGGYDSQQIIAGSLGQQMGQLGMEMTRRNMQIQPTLKVRPGYQFNVMVTKDMILKPWTAK